MEPLRLLLVEDSEDDAIVLCRHLRSEQFDVTLHRVETLDALETALAEGGWDVVLTDYVLPGLDGLEVVRAVRRRDADLPVLVVSGQIGEAMAVATMRTGANDYIMKDSLARLGPAIRREMEDVKVRRERRQVAARLEREIQRAQRLESLGLLAGGIAHDFNNILTGVLGNISLCRTLVAPSDPIHERLLEAEKALLRARDLTAQLLTFARGGMPVKKPSDLRDLILESATFVLRGSRSKCEFDLPDDLWPVEVDPGQISRVIENLVLNADQAMPEGGVITIRAQNLLDPGGSLRRVQVSVTDHGVGIPEEHLEHLFDPYFTTKKGGRGLGLATCYSILRHHGGSISVESRVGHGSTFSLVLPATTATPPRTRDSGDGIPRGHGRVLVLDDEPLVRSVATQILGHLGYEAVAVADGREAVAHYRQARESGRPFDLVVLDLTVPGGVGGVETLDLLRRLDPEVRAVVSSGYSSDPIMADYPKHGFRGVVAKPYTVGEMGRMLREVLAHRARGSENP